jgi:hypothetical protein
VLRTTSIGKRVGIILGLTLAGMAALAIFLFWYSGGQEKAATREANRFVAALVKDDPSAAPPKGDEYVRGIWRVYRRIDSADLIGTHQRSTHHSTSGSSHSWWVADMLLHTGRGLAVVELAFEPNHLNPDTQVIDLMYELTPDRIPGKALDDGTLTRVKSDQRERGSVANDFTFTFDNPSPPRTPGPTPGKPVQPTHPPKFETPPVIKCIRRAHGDVTKIQKCARLANPGA